MSSPLDLSFNIAVKRMSDLVCPCGFDVTGYEAPLGSEPTTLEALNEHIARTGRILVSGEHSDKTIFGCPEHNAAFRAWHDWTHWRYQLPFTFWGEFNAYLMQYCDLSKAYGHSDPRVAWDGNWRKLLYAEIVGELEYNQTHNGEFPVDQRAFIEAYLANPGDAISPLRVF